VQIRKVYIKNFRCHKNLKLWPHQLHTIVGENGSGKTAILEAINLCTSKLLSASQISELDFCNGTQDDIFIQVSFDNYFVVVIPDGNFNDKKLICDSVTLKIKHRSKASPGKLLCDGYVIDHWVQPKTYENINILEDAKMPTGIQKGDLPEYVRAEPQANDAFKYIIPRKSGESEKYLDKRQLAFTNEMIGFPVVFYFDKKRDSQAKNSFNSLLSRITDDLNWRYRGKLDETETVQLYEEYHSSIVSEVDKHKNQKILQSTLEKIKTFVGRENFDLELSLLNIKQPFSKSFLSVRDGIHQITLDGLGSGTSIVIAYFLLETISTLSKEKIIILIDEPELHLHPQWQRNLFAHFQVAKHQTILSTHSNLFIGLRNWRTVSRLSAGQIYPSQTTLQLIVSGEKLQEHLDDIVVKRKLDTIFVDGDSELFFARKVLLVEGPVDKYGIIKLPRYLRLDMPDLTIISCNGKTKIKFYYYVCRAFNTDCFVLFDQDKNKPDYMTSEKAHNDLLFSMLETNIFGYEDSFETLFGSKSARALETIDTIVEDGGNVPAEIETSIKKIYAWYCSLPLSQVIETEATAKQL
jgi:predicted ATP-dependent endonuclease of OLD family